MKRAGWYLVTGAVAGFAGVVGFHSVGPAAPTALGPLKPAGTGATPAPSATAPGPARTAGPTAGRPAGPARTATGAVEQYGYGELSVTVTVRGGQITAVSVPMLRTAEQYSQQLALQVIPMLKAEVLAVHSDRIHGVSGATYTSVAYAQSIQSALDKLHAR